MSILEKSLHLFWNVVEFSFPIFAVLFAVMVVVGFVLFLCIVAASIMMAISTVWHYTSPLNYLILSNSSRGNPLKVALEKEGFKNVRIAQKEGVFGRKTFVFFEKDSQEYKWKLPHEGVKFLQCCNERQEGINSIVLKTNGIKVVR